PGGLQAILQVFETAGVNVEYMYAFVQKNSENATLIFRLDRIEYALEELKKNNIAVLPVSKVCGSN
ncbi:MAG: amino acid-binding protein, partial [Mailhella sp.]|nr:amino acid-binding protein [Mailhella sp.]